VPLDTFSIEGRRRGNLRRAWRKAAEEGATFEIVQGDSLMRLLALGRGVSRILELKGKVTALRPRRKARGEAGAA